MTFNYKLSTCLEKKKIKQNKNKKIEKFGKTSKMDNLKNLFGMSSSVKSDQENTFKTNLGISGLINGVSARNRSDSECSNISDVSVGSITTTTNPRQIKNKDSESYFWIM